MLWKAGAGGSGTLALSTMSFGFLENLSVFGSQSNHEVVPESQLLSAHSSKGKENIQPKSPYLLRAMKPLQNSLLSIISWGKKNTHEPHDQKSRLDSMHMKIHNSVESGCPLPLFRPYVAKVPWHKGLRAFLSQMFPRYGHYCGPNWSSGKDNGTQLWDRRPVDWLDLCCYFHDMGYDTHDQAKLLKADLTFLQCLEKQTKFKDDDHWAYFYSSLYRAGLKTILIPYRTHLVKWQGVENMKSPSMRQRGEIQHAC